MKPRYTNQCMIPTHVHCSMRVWRKVSLTIVIVRRTGSPVRPVAGWPTLTVPTIDRTAWVVSTTATAVKPRETTMAKI